MSTPRNDSQPSEPDTNARDGHNLADIQRDAETLRARQQRDFDRYREKLSAEVAELQATLGAIIADESAAPAEPAELAESAHAADAHTASRRTLLKWGGLGAAATLAAAGGASLAVPTARAADGGNVILGASNQGEHTTEIAYDGAETNPVVFRATVGSTNSTAISATVGSGTTDTTSGVSGSAGTNGKGVRGTANGSTAFGVWGVSASGYGIVGESGSGIDLAATGTGRLLQASSGSTGAPASGSYSVGEQIRDAVGNLYICVTSGSPGVWLKVVGQPVGYRGGTITFLPTPIRVYDSRPSNNPLVGNGVRDVQVTGVTIGGVQVPAGASGCIGNLTVVRPTTGGYLVIYPQGSRTPGSSTVNYVAYQTIPNSFWVGLSGSGQVTVHAFQSGNCQFIVDIAGYIA